MGSLLDEIPVLRTYLLFHSLYVTMDKVMNDDITLRPTTRLMSRKDRCCRPCCLLRFVKSEDAMMVQLFELLIVSCCALYRQ